MTMRDHIQENSGPNDEFWVDCWNCGGEGEIEGDCTCGEDCCCCLEPEPPSCSECRGKGGWWRPMFEKSNGGVSAKDNEHG